MRLFLSLIGVAALAATGWITWHATERSRQWREFQTLGSKTKPSVVERTRFLDLSRRFFPDETFRVCGLTVLDGPEDRRRILVLFVPTDQGNRQARLHVLDEDGGRRSSSLIPRGPCGVECRPAHDRGPWVFDVARLTPASPTLQPYRLVDDRPVPVGHQADPDNE